MGEGRIGREHSKGDVKNIEKGPEPFSWKMVGVKNSLKEFING